MRLLILILCLGCAEEEQTPADAAPVQDAGAESPPAAPTPHHSECGLITDACALPYPNSLFLRVDESTPSGLRLDMAGPGLGPLWPKLAGATHDGFSPTGAIVTLVPTALTLDDLPKTLAESTADDAPAWLLEAAHQGERGRRIPYAVELFAGEAQQLLVLTPHRDLPTGGRYAVLLRATLGGPSEAMSALVDEAEPGDDLAPYWRAFADLRALLEEVEVAPGDVGQLWDFHVRSDENLRGALRTMVAFNRDWVAEHPPKPVLEDRGLIGTHTRYGLEVELPIWREDREAWIAMGDDDRPTPLRFEPVPGSVVLPESATAERPAAPVLFGHGLSASGELMVLQLRDLDLDAGPIAGGVFDWDLHGTRGRGVTDILELAGNLDVLAFSAMLMQSIADAVVYAEVLEALPGVPDLGERFAPAPLLYVGQSLGSLLGASIAALDPRYDAYALNVGGMGVTNILRRGAVLDRLGLGPKLLQRIEEEPPQGLEPELAIQVLLIASQVALDFADPGAFVREVKPDTPILLQQSVGDGIIPNATTDQLARSLDLVSIGPEVRSVEGLRTARAPTLGSPAAGMTQFRVTEPGFQAHLAFSHPVVQEQVIDYLGSWLDADEGNDGDISYRCEGPCDLVEED